MILIEIAPKPTPPITGAPTPDPGAPCNCNYSSLLVLLLNVIYFQYIYHVINVSSLMTLNHVNVIGVLIQVLLVMVNVTKR